MKKPEKNKLTAILGVILTLIFCFVLSSAWQKFTYHFNEKTLAAALQKSAVDQICIVPSGAVKKDMNMGNFYAVVDEKNINLGKTWRGPTGDNSLAVAIFLKNNKVYKTLIVKSSTAAPYLEEKESACLIPAEREG
jgi:hypothetical protein